jgi:aryl-alcohol dehydrogenase-like predicted oxidoreductase
MDIPRRWSAGALREMREGERPFVFTKGGQRPDPSDPFAEPQHDLRPEFIHGEVEASLRRLGVERIDLYQFHWPDETGTPVEESWAEMARLVDEGKVRAAGVSNFDTSLLARCEAIRHVDSLEPPFSLINRTTAEDLLPWCKDNGTGVIVYSPMQSGLLTGSVSADRVAQRARDPRCRRSWSSWPSGSQGEMT